MTEAATPVNKDIIDGSEVVSRTQARIFTPMSKYEDGKSPTYGVDECVLADARVVYQCVHPDPPENCDYWADNGFSVRSHLRKHANLKEKTAYELLQAERDELAARIQKRQESYHIGALKGAAKRRENRENQLNGTNGNTDTENGNEGVSMTPKEIQRKLDNAQTSLEGLHSGLSKVNTVLLNMMNTAENVNALLEEVSSAEPTVDPVTADKAARWDALQGLMGNKTPNKR